MVLMDQYDHGSNNQWLRQHKQCSNHKNNCNNQPMTMAATNHLRKCIGVPTGDKFCSIRIGFRRDLPQY